MALLGANLDWPKDLSLGLCRLGNEPDRGSVILFGVLNAAPFWSGAVVGSLVSDYVINERRFGRLVPFS